MSFRTRLLATLRAVRPVLEEPGVLIVGSEVPNLLQPNAASTLVVSQDVDIGVPVTAHAAVKRTLAQIDGLDPSTDEPSVWLPRSSDLLEVNFVGIDPDTGPGEAYVLDDDELPLLVFGALSLVRQGTTADIDQVLLPLPRIAGMLLEKLVTERTGEKGERDLLVALGLLLVAEPSDLTELEHQFEALAAEHQHVVVSNLTLLSLMKRHANMPDPEPERARLARLLRRLSEVASPEAV